VGVISVVTMTGVGELLASVGQRLENARYPAMFGIVHKLSCIVDGSGR
jgi:hypothetical protein